MSSNAFSAADMTTAAASGHRDGYQAGYADAVKAVEVGKPAAAQEAVAVWTVTREGDPTFPRAYFSEAAADAMVAHITLAPFAVKRAPVAAAPVEMSPEFTCAARAAISWVLWHHQGSSSPVGQPLRLALGMGLHEPMPEWRIAEAKRHAELAGATTADFHKARASTPAAPGIDLEQFLPHTHAVIDKMQDVMAVHGFAVPVRVISDAFRTTLLCQQGGKIDASPKCGSDATAFYDASAKGFHISETCGPDGKYHAVSKFQTLADLHAFEDARRTLLIAERDRRELQATSAEVGA